MTGPGRAVAEELHSVAHGNPAREQRLAAALTRLAAGAGGPDLQQMAAEVLAGQVTLRRAMLSSAYTQALGPSAERLLNWYESQGRA